MNNLFFSFFCISRCMYKIWDSYLGSISMCIGHMSIISSNSSWSSRFWFCTTNHFTNIVYNIHSFKYHRNNGEFCHHIDSDIKDILSMSSNHSTNSFIVMMKKRFIWANHFHTNNMKSCSFKTRDDFSSNTTTYTIRFQHYQSSLYVSHFYNNNKK